MHLDKSVHRSNRNEYQCCQQYFVLSPQSYGQLGEGTTYASVGGERTLIKLSVMLEYPPVDDFWSVGGDSYLVSIALADGLRKSGLREYVLDDVRFYKWDQFDLASPEHKHDSLPKARWLKVVGTGLKDDIGLHRNVLVVSEPALEFLRTFKIAGCEITRFEEFLFDWEARKKQLFARAEQRLKQLGLSKSDKLPAEYSKYRRPT